MEGNKYVTDEVFRSEIRRIEQQVDNAVERIELKLDAFTARIDTRFAKMDGRIDTIEAKVDTLTHFVGWTIGLLTLAVTIGSIIIPLLK